MDVSSISAAAMSMQSARTQRTMGTTLLKMAAEQQSQMVDVLAQSAENASRIMGDSGYNFSVYA